MENQPQENCRNCQQPLPTGAKFCPKCGQKNTDGRLTFFQLLKDFADHLLNLDAKIFNTLKALATPGQLTGNYFKGKHVPYYHPVRLFIVAGAALIALISLNVSQADIGDLGWERKKEGHLKHVHFLALDSIRQGLVKEYRQPTAATALDSLLRRFAGKEDLARPDSISINKNLNFTFDQSTSNIRISVEDMMNLSESAIVDQYGVADFWQRLMFRQNIRIQKNGDKIIYYLIGNTLWMMLVMMPMLALVLKLLYIRRQFYYFEHLVFSFHTHTFAFLLIALLLLLDNFLPSSIFLWGFLGLAVYLYLAMKRFYGQSWRKTLLKFMMANFMYLFVASVALFITALASLAFF